MSKQKTTLSDAIKDKLTTFTYVGNCECGEKKYDVTNKENNLYYATVHEMTITSLGVNVDSFDSFYPVPYFDGLNVHYFDGLDFI